MASRQGLGDDLRAARDWKDPVAAWDMSRDRNRFRISKMDGPRGGPRSSDRWRDASAVIAGDVKNHRQCQSIDLPDPSYFKIAAADLVADGLPDLADRTAQQFYDDIVADAHCVAVDNLSTLCRSLKENDADSWAPVQSWVLSLRRQGKTVILLHHGGKSGTQRGTSKKEDVLNSVIALRRPPDYSADQGARFEIHFEKSRGFHGQEAAPFEARLIENQWSIANIRTGDDQATLQALHKQGLSIRIIAERTGLSKSTVQRRLGEGDDE